jgi:radical SAM PhpK family P-methyltransferase
MDFVEYEKNIRKMGKDSGAYRDLNLSFICHNNIPYHASGIFNLLCKNSKTGLSHGESFSAAIAYLGTYLYRRGFTFDYINSFQDEKDVLAEKLKKENILTIAITTTLYVSVFPILEIVDFIKRHNRSARIIVGGPFISTQVRNVNAMTSTYLFNSIGADVYVNSSQGEATLVKIIDTLKNERPLNRISNIYYKTENRSYTSTPVIRENNRLSENMVDWSLFSHRVGEYVVLRTSISCPFSCAFCGFPEHAGKYQTANVKAIKQELDSLGPIKSVKSIYFIDDTFNVPMNRFKEILRMMIKNKYKFKWHSNFRCQFADREMVDLMKASGCEGVFLGIESGNDQILKNMNKSANIEKYLEGIAMLKEAGIITYGSFIIGFPGETSETLKDTVRFIEESGVDLYRAQLWYCEPITPIWKMREKYKITGSNFEWVHATMDAKTAANLVEEMFLSINNSLWVPQYGFDFCNLFHLTNRGIDWGKIKNFIRSFNEGIKDKLINPSVTEVSAEVMNRIKNALILDDSHYSAIMTDKPGEEDDDLIIDFDL